MTNFDQHLDPPNPPERAKCARCGNIFTYDDMETIDHPEIEPSEDELKIEPDENEEDED